MDRHYDDVESSSSKPLIPGGYEWRMWRARQHAEHDRILGDFKRFGRDD